MLERLANDSRDQFPPLGKELRECHLGPAIRQGIKEFSNWPTIPQLYVKGEFIGGCDIVREMFQANELPQYFKDKGIPVRVQASA